jgi:hypothetical protein
MLSSWGATAGRGNRGEGQRGRGKGRGSGSVGRKNYANGSINASSSAAPFETVNEDNSAVAGEPTLAPWESGSDGTMLNKSELMAQNEFDDLMGFPRYLEGPQKLGWMVNMVPVRIPSFLFQIQSSGLIIHMLFPNACRLFFMMMVRRTERLLLIYTFSKMTDHLSK